MLKKREWCMTRKFCTIDHPETSEVEVGGDGEAIRVNVSDDEALAPAKPTRTHKEQLNKQPLCALIQKLLMSQRRVPAPRQDCNIGANSNLLMCAMTRAATIETSLGTFPRFAPIKTGEFSVSNFLISVHSVLKHYRWSL